MSQAHSRRSFLRNAGAAVSAASLPAWLPELASAANVPVREERQRAVVIGSGFGGAVTALRLGQAGVPVLVLERGMRWASGGWNTFPSGTRPDRRTAWLGTKPQLAFYQYWKNYTGLLEQIPGQGMSIQCAAAVGGGSLPYHGVSLQPRGDLFERVMPAEIDYTEMAQVYYPRVAAALGIGTIPDDVLASKHYLSSRVFAEYCLKAGLPPITRLPMTIDWQAARDEIAGRTPAWMTKGEAVLGVNGPGKKSLDTNYLPAAEATGNVEIRPLHMVTAIEPDGHGRWVVRVDHLNTAGRAIERLVITTDALFLTAGSPNTSKLLVRAKGTGAIPTLPDEVGQYWGNNGDLIQYVTVPEDTGTYQGGPANIATLDWDNPDGPLTVIHGPIPVPVETHQLGTIGMVIPEGHGSFSYNGVADSVHLSWPPRRCS